MKNQKSKKRGFMALKLNIRKAYDRVEWRFLEQIMRKMGFCSQWVDLIMSCIGSASYQVLVNGVPEGEIWPTRGIRQGNPLSPYLFLVCSEALNQQLQFAANSGAIRGFSLCREGPKISHLFFADNTLLFCHATKGDLEVILHILQLYELASGQKLNREKTMVESLNYIKERVWHKLQGWKERLLSQAGKEVLLKAVVQAILTFAMSCFKLPTGLIQDIESLIRKFWWGQRGDQRKTHWKNWETLCKPKVLEGMGFKDLVKFNEAMLAKHL